MTYYRSTHEIAGEIDLGRASQIRYVQGDAEAVMIRMNGRWHRVPLGGVVSGESTHCKARSIFTHRATSATFEFGGRSVDTIPQIEFSRAFRDQLRVGVDWTEADDGAETFCLVAAAGQAVKVSQSRDLDAVAEVLVLPRPADVASFTYHANHEDMIRKVGLSDLAPEVLLTPKAMAWQGQNSRAAIVDLQQPFVVTDRHVLRINYTVDVTADSRSFYAAQALGLVDG